MSLNLLTTLPEKRIEMQIICRGVDGIKVQLWEPIARYRARLSENGLRGRIEMALLLGKPFCVKKVSSFLYSRPHLLFHQTRTHLGGGGGGCHPHAISLLSVIKLRDRDQRIAWDVPNLMVCELTYLGPPLIFQVR